MKNFVIEDMYEVHFTWTDENGNYWDEREGGIGAEELELITNNLLRNCAEIHSIDFHPVKAVIFTEED